MNRILVTVLFFLFTIPLDSAGQRAIGIDWSVPESYSEAEMQLQHYADIGISYLQINEPLESGTWREIDELGFVVYAKLPINFPIAETISGADSARIDSLSAIIAHFNRQPSVEAVGAFAFGALQNDVFKRLAADFTIDLRNKTEKPLYYTTAEGNESAIDSLYSFKMLRLPATEPGVLKNEPVSAFIFRPAESEKRDLGVLKNQLEQTADSPQQPIFLEASWLRDMEKRHPNLGQILSSYTAAGNAVFPLPENSPQPYSSASAIAVLLLLAWVLFAVTYSYDPVYRKSFVRYFIGHRFFVNDVMKRHIRSPFTGGSIMIQHAISGGILVYVVFKVFFTSLGYEALIYHYPLLPDPDGGGLNLFFWGFLLAFGFQMVCLAWLWAAHSGVSSITQIINLYAWPLQLNLFTATLISLFFLSGPRPNFIYGVSIVFVLFFVLSFIITAADAGRFLRTKKIQYYAITMGLYLFGLIGLGTWLFSSTSLQNVVELAASLP